MRLMLAIFLLVALVIVDKYRFNGHYGSQVSHLMASAIR